MESLPNFYMEEITDADLDEIFGPMEVEEQTLEATPETEVSRVRFACLNEQQLGEIEEGRVEKTTERATKWGVKLLKEWLTARDLDTDFEELPPENLAPLLRSFYAEVRKDDGTPYAKASYGCLRAAIHRHLTGPPFHRKYNILKDTEFKAANNVYTGMLKKLRREGKDTAKAHQPILLTDIQKMFETKTLSVNSPVSLQRLVYFYIAFYLCRRGRENLRNFKVSDFVAKTDGGRRYYTLKFNEHQKNHSGDLPNDDQPTPRLYESLSDARPCPVQAFELYCSKLQQAKCPFLFQRPNLHWKPGSCAPWYFAQPVGVNKIGFMMREISQAAGLSQDYTNHCIRVTAIQVLDQAGFENRVIMSLSGHRNESSIRRYTHDSTESQKVGMSNALEAALGSSDKTGDSEGVCGNLPGPRAAVGETSSGRPQSTLHSQIGPDPRAAVGEMASHRPQSTMHSQVGPDPRAAVAAVGETTSHRPQSMLHSQVGPDPRAAVAAVGETTSHRLQSMLHSQVGPDPRAAVAAVGETTSHRPQSMLHSQVGPDPRAAVAAVGETTSHRPQSMLHSQVGPDPRAAVALVGETASHQPQSTLHSQVGPDPRAAAGEMASENAVASGSCPPGQDEPGAADRPLHARTAGRQLCRPSATTKPWLKKTE
ncbi:hypothetical protein Bbelb_314090 [Branchiostoma belcheri]|nr:hypothetical protein Bbelb_314090 [Branchiostoma belcheri]